MSLLGEIITGLKDWWAGYEARIEILEQGAFLTPSDVETPKEERLRYLNGTVELLLSSG